MQSAKRDNRTKTMTPEQLAVIDNFKCDNCGKCEACLLIEEFVANEKILKKKGTPDERLAKEIVGKWGYEEAYWWKPIAEAFAQIRADERAKVIGEVREKLYKMYVEDIKKYPECTWNSAIDEVKDLLTHLTPAER
jgi:hypothetical protein